MYYIYHIPGIKIGCTINPKHRIKDQGFEEYEILEKHSDIMIASKRELILQKQYGLPVDDVEYFKTFKLSYLPERLNAVKNSELHKKSTTNNFKKGNKSEAGKLGALKSMQLGVGAMCITKEQRIEIGKKSGAKNVESGHIKQLGKKYGIMVGKLQQAKIHTCPHCNITMKGPNYFRYHGEKCKSIK